MTALPAMALAIALSYLVIDFLKPFLPSGILLWVINTVIFIIIYQVSNRFLKSLKE